MNSTFDRHSNDYRQSVNAALSLTGARIDALAASKAALILRIARTLGAADRLRVLDIGCGIGVVDRHLAPKVQSLVGADVSTASLEVAREALPDCSFIAFDGKRLPFADNSFDVTLTSCVLHHIEIGQRQEFVCEMARLTRVGGIIAIIEHNPFNPVTRWVVDHCPFDEDAVLLRASEAVELLDAAPTSEARVAYFGFLPYRSAAVDNFERWIARIPIGAQYCAWAVKSRDVQ